MIYRVSIKWIDVYYNIGSFLKVEKISTLIFILKISFLLFCFGFLGVFCGVFFLGGLFPSLSFMQIIHVYILRDNNQTRIMLLPENNQRKYNVCKLTVFQRIHYRIIGTFKRRYRLLSKTPHHMANYKLIIGERGGGRLQKE